MSKVIKTEVSEKKVFGLFQNQIPLNLSGDFSRNCTKLAHNLNFRNLYFLPAIHLQIMFIRKMFWTEY